MTVPRASLGIPCICASMGNEYPAEFDFDQKETVGKEAG